MNLGRECRIQKSRGVNIPISLKVKLKVKQQNIVREQRGILRAPYNSQRQREMITHLAHPRTVSMQ